MNILHLQSKNSKNIPILIAPGWSETCKILEPLALSLQNELSREVITLTHPRTGTKTQKHIIYPCEEWRKANNLKNLLDSKGIKKVDVIAHSEGGINSIIFATEFSQYVRNIVLVNPAGIIGKDSFLQLAQRFSHEIISARFTNKPKQKPVKPFIYFQKEACKYMFLNPLRALKEVIAISQFQTPLLIKALIKKNISVSIIYGEIDKVFPAERITKTIKNISFKNSHIVKNGGHLDICLFPKNYTQLIKECLE